MQDVFKYYQNFKALENDLVTLLRFVELSEENYQVNSAEIRKLILASCSMIESLTPALKNDLQYNTLQEKTESAAQYIFRITKEKNIDITNLKPIIYGKKFNPWEENRLKEWWNAYNTIKHSEKDQDNINFFEAAINSVVAFFVLVALLTRKTSIHIFWHEYDLIKLSGDTDSPIPYNQQSSISSIFKWI